MGCITRGIDSMGAENESLLPNDVEASASQASLGSKLTDILAAPHKSRTAAPLKATTPSGSGGDCEPALLLLGVRPGDAGAETDCTQTAPTSRCPVRAATLCTALSILAICAGLVLFRVRLKAVLVWLETQPPDVSWLVFVALFTAVSFPMTFGYLLLNLACGYLYGVEYGLAVTGVSAACGMAVAHVTVRGCFLAAAKESFRGGGGNYAAILSVINGPAGLKVVVLTRLTPIPFGLQNALFAVSSVSRTSYLVASAVGLLPTQLMNAYIGSTLRSLEDVWDSRSSDAITTYAVFLLQILFSVVLVVFIVQQARRELQRTLNQQQSGAASKEPGLTAVVTSLGGARH